jgi:hypothetical protein
MQPRALLLTVLANSCFMGTGLSQELNETWVVTVNGQTVQVEPNGRFSIQNVSAADQFGASGPGSGPDLFSDDTMRLTGTGQWQGEQWYAYSAGFQIKQNQLYVVKNLTFTKVPPPMPKSLTLQLGDSVIELGSTTFTSVQAFLGNGTQQAVNGKSQWTSYASSNPNIAEVNEEGIVEGVKKGIAFITAKNGGATAVRSIVVTEPNPPKTTVVGFVELPDGSPVGGATVKLLGQGLSTTTLSSGYFSIDEVVTSLGPITVIANANVAGVGLTGSSGGLEGVPDGFTDAGLIRIEEPEKVLVFGVRIDGIQQAQAVEQLLVQLGYDAEYQATLPSDLSMYRTIWHAQSSSALTPLEEAELIAFVQGGGSLHLGGERPCCEAANQSIEDVVNGITGLSLQFGNQGDVPPPYLVNQAAIGGVPSTPNALTNLPLCFAGGISGTIPDQYVLARGTNNRPVALALDCPLMPAGAGRVIVVMDTDWNFPGGCPSNPTPVPAIQNFMTFLSGTGDCK